MSQRLASGLVSVGFVISIGIAGYAAPSDQGVACCEGDAMQAKQWHPEELPRYKRVYRVEAVLIAKGAVVVEMCFGATRVNWYQVTASHLGGMPNGSIIPVRQREYSGRQKEQTPERVGQRVLLVVVGPCTLTSLPPGWTGSVPQRIPPTTKELADNWPRAFDLRLWDSPSTTAESRLAFESVLISVARARQTASWFAAHVGRTERWTSFAAW